MKACIYALIVHTTEHGTVKNPMLYLLYLSTRTHEVIYVEDGRDTAGAHSAEPLHRALGALVPEKSYHLLVNFSHHSQPLLAVRVQLYTPHAHLYLQYITL